MVQQHLGFFTWWLREDGYYEVSDSSVWYTVYRKRT